MPRQVIALLMYRQAKLWLLLQGILLTVNSCSYRQEVSMTSLVKQWGLFEKAIISTNPYSNAQKYKDVIVRATFTGPGGVRYTVPGFWDGHNVWRIRFSPTLPGNWTYTIDSNDDQLNAPQNDGGFAALEPTSDDIVANPNYRGFLKLDAGHRHLTYNDGTPFFWLGDTLWDGNSKNMPYETDFKSYVDNRRQKRFSVIQILVAEPRRRDIQLSDRGCHPPRYTGCNEAGYVYNLPSTSSRILSRVQRLIISSANKYPEEISPQSFQNLDLRLKYILDKGMVPYIVFGWAKDFGAISTDSLKPYVRYIIARYQAYNVIWCISGEHYFLKDKARFKAIGNYVREIDALNHLTTIHGWMPGDFVGEPWIDFISSTAWGLPSQIHDLMLRDFYRPGLPFVLSESRYDGNEPTAQYRSRKYALEALTAGAMGYTYGADGIWNWGTDPQYPNSHNRLDIPSSLEMKLIAEFFANIQWWKLSPNDDLASKGRCLAEAGKQYAIWLDGGGSVTVTLPKYPSRFSAVWFDPIHGITTTSNGVTVGGKQTFTPPFDGDALFYITLHASRSSSDRTQATSH
jgi:hypothetical protein